MEILYYFYIIFWKNLRGILGKYAIIGIDIDIDNFRQKT